MSKERYNYAMYLASVFVVRKGDDPLTWDTNTANEYITDWAAEGLSEQDFFQFALLTVSGFQEHYKKLKAEADAEAGRLLAIGSFLPRGKDSSTPKK